MNNATTAACDVLVISPHTDDAEIGLGGTIALLGQKGRRVWALDLTRGELGTNATPDERWDEAKRASQILGLAGRVQLDLPDGFITETDRTQVGQIVAVLRRLRPRWVITAPDPVRHPDHRATPALVRKAVFMARLHSWQPELEGFRLWPAEAKLPDAAPRWAVESRWFVCPDNATPSAVFDVSQVWEIKERALACYASQFGRQSGQVSTTINDPAFMAKVDRRARTWGRRAKVELGEAFCTDAAPVYNDMPGERWLE